MQLTPYQKRTAAWVLIAALAGVLLWLLAPVLMPFIVAGVLAYALNPLVNRLDGCLHRRMPRWAAVLLVQLLFMLLASGVVMLIVPVLLKEAPILRNQIPVLLDSAGTWLQATLARVGVQVDLSKTGVREMVVQYLQGDNSSVTVESVLSSLKMGGNVAVGVVGNLLLIPLVLFYWLRDWNHFTATLYHLVPRRWSATVHSFLDEADAVLGQYLRGQLLVMLALVVYYSVMLMLFGLDLALPVGVLTGLLSFVPYLGFALGLGMAALLGILQLGLMQALIMLTVVYGLGQILESFVLTPQLVGERIGLHPLLVVFALLAFGQLFGFVGVLVALPCSAVLLVAVRRIRHGYLQSTLYTQ